MLHDIPGPKGTEKTVLDWSVEPDGIFVTLKPGYCFDTPGHSSSASHVRSFQSSTEARKAIALKRLERCTCARCGGTDEE